jgi:hypothetical protein
MNCAELQHDLPEILESGGTPSQREHLRTCSGCTELVSELQLIAQEARLLRASEEPSPRVWNSIEIALRKEGLIRPSPRGAVVAGFSHRWSPVWLLSVAAALLVSFGVIRYEHGLVQQQEARRSAPVPTITASVAAEPVMPADDRQFLEVVSAQAPAMRSAYETDLQNVNAYIRDAEASARAHPNDEDAQRYLMDAYDQKAMVYEMAMDRSLP